MLVIAKTPVNPTEEAWVVVDVFRGRTLVHCRRYYRDGDEWKPGKGLALPVDLLPWLADAVQGALTACVKTGEVLEEDFGNAGLTPPPGLFAA